MHTPANNLQPKVSILIPTYNQEKFITHAVYSALQQSYENIEIIIADDCSDPDIKSVIQKFLSNQKVKYFKNEINIGRVANYKKALYQYATGEWVLCLDGDDYLTDDNYINECVTVIEKYKNKNSRIVFIQAGDELKNIITNRTTFRLPKINNSYAHIKGWEYFKNFINYEHFSHCTSLYNRQQAMDTGFYLNDILSADIESFLKLSLSGDVILFKKVVAVWLQHGNNASKNINIDIHIKNISWIDNCKEYAEKKLPSKQKEIKTWYTRTLANYLSAIITLIRINAAALPNSLSKLKSLVKYSKNKGQRLIFNKHFIYNYIYSYISLLKKRRTN